MAGRDDSTLALGDPSLLRAETEEALCVEPRLLVDARFLGGVHARLRHALSGPEAAGMLLRAGFCQGLRDALRVVRSPSASPATPSPPPSPTRLPIQFAGAAHATRFGLEARGRWPHALEARGCRQHRLDAGLAGCAASAGYTSGWLSGLWNGSYYAHETHCILAGARACRFRVREAAAWQRSGRCERMLLDELQFDPLRARVSAELAAGAASPEDRFDAEAPVIHVWGPVMVVPFSGADESVHGVELIGRDPGARDVRVVVLDLTGTALDEGFGALALERVLDAVESWGAEPILAGLGSPNERVVARLERHNLMIEKDVAQAIAVAFQVADAQQRPL